MGALQLESLLCDDGVDRINDCDDKDDRIIDQIDEKMKYEKGSLDDLRTRSVVPRARTTPNTENDFQFSGALWYSKPVAPFDADAMNHVEQGLPRSKIIATAGGIRSGRLVPRFTELKLNRLVASVDASSIVSHFFSIISQHL